VRGTLPSPASCDRAINCTKHNSVGNGVFNHKSTSVVDTVSRRRGRESITTGVEQHPMRLSLKDMLMRLVRLQTEQENIHYILTNAEYLDENRLQQLKARLLVVREELVKVTAAFLPTTTK
jgi:hypothetical protein